MNSRLNGNWVDLIIIAILLYYASEAWRYGFFYILSDFVSFLLSLLISLRTYKFAAVFLVKNFNLPESFANALGFIGSSIILEIIIGQILNAIVSRLPKKVLNSSINKILGLIPALGEGIVLIAFLITAIIALPVKPELKKAVSESRFGGLILKETSGIEKAINQVFGGAINDALTYFTIEPGSKSTIKLTGGVEKLSVDSESENKMLIDLNNERTSRGIAPLSIDSRYTTIARAYATDMWQRQYFSHYNPEGETVADRFNAAHIDYSFVGENLALAPTETTAMTGLMNSPGHKANILDSRFKKVGIGVIDNGFYGKMFVQEFSD